MTILSNGSFFWLWTNQTIASGKIALFLPNLSKWLSVNKNFNYSDILLLLDNWFIQKLKMVKDQISRWKWKAMYLPVYSLVFAAIENWISMIKSYLKR